MTADERQAVRRESGQIDMFATPPPTGTADPGWWSQRIDETLGAWRDRIYEEHVREHEGPRCSGCGCPVVVCFRAQQPGRHGKIGLRCPDRPAL